jgi:hypothetical protein
MFVVVIDWLHLYHGVKWCTVSNYENELNNKFVIIITENYQPAFENCSPCEIHSDDNLICTTFQG